MGIYMVYPITHAVTWSNFFLLNVLNLLPVWISNCFTRSREHLIAALEFKLQTPQGTGAVLEATGYSGNQQWTVS